jgi:uncharacterized LabA/DUF88 family protein
MAIESDHAADAALLIDWENLKFSLKERDVLPNVSAIRDAAESFGRVVVARAYADWQDGWHHGDPSNLYAAGIEPIYVPTRRYWEDTNSEKRKNSVDVKLTADCIELCHNHESITMYVLVTGDQDFLHVVNTLRPYGKRVVIVGVSWSTSARLAERVDNVIYYDREVDPIEPETLDNGKEPAVDERDRAVDAALAEVMRSSNVEDDLVPELKRLLNEIVGIVHDLRSRGQQVLLSALGMEIAKRFSSQSYSMLAKGKLKQLAGALQTARLIRVETQGLVDWLYLPDETPPEAALPQDEAQMVPSYVTEHFVQLPQGERAEVVRTIRVARSRPNVSYLTFNRLCDELRSTSPARRMGGDVRRFVEGMIEAGILTQDVEQHQWFDPPSGRTGVFSSFSLNRSHNLVRDVDSPD